MKKTAILLKFVLLATFFHTSIATAQDHKTLVFSPESQITVDGTSNRDDWIVTAPEFEGSVTIREDSGNFPEVIEAQFIVKAGQMTGGRGGVMDRIMLNALKANQYPDIIFLLTEVETIPGSGNNQGFMVRSAGDLTIAGVTRPIELELQGRKMTNGGYRFQGSHSLLMSDYDIDRPTAMFGSLVTGDEVVINVDVITVN